MRLYNIKKYLLFLFYFSGLSAQGYSLDDCIQSALEGKKTVLSAQLGVISAEQGLKSSYSNLLPFVQATTGVGKTQSSNQESYQFDYNNFSAGLSLSQKIYNGGQSLNQVKQARSALEIEKLNHRSTKIRVIENVIKSYYGLLKAQKLMNVAEKNLEMSDQQLSLVKEKFDLGVVKRSDFLKAQVAQGQAKVEALNKQISLENSRRKLFNDMGLQDFGQTINAIDEIWIMPVIPSSSEILDLLKTQNPSILIAQNQVNLRELSYKIVKGLRMPSLNSSINYSANGTNADELVNALKDGWTLGMNLSLSVPIFTGNSLSIQQQQAKISRQRSEYSYVTLLNDLKVQAELIRESLNNYAEIIPLNRAVIASAQEDLNLVRERYSLGSATIVNLLDAQVSEISSSSALINTIHDARMQHANLKALLGTLDIEYQIEEEYNVK